LKFFDLQDFYVRLFIIADGARKREFEAKIKLQAFDNVQKRVKFATYDDISEWHTKSYELYAIEAKIR
jgi:hypothetical protein